MSKTLLVCTNPYFATDHRGCPAGAVHREFVKNRGGLSRATEYIGARRADNPELEREAPTAEPKGGQLRTARHHVRYIFDPGPIRIDDTRYNRRQVVEGALIAADEATAKTCGVGFVEPDTVRAKWRDRSGCKVEPLWKPTGDVQAKAETKAPAES